MCIDAKQRLGCKGTDMGQFYDKTANDVGSLDDGSGMEHIVTQHRAGLELGRMWDETDIILGRK